MRERVWCVWVRYGGFAYDNHLPKACTRILYRLQPIPAQERYIWVSRQTFPDLETRPATNYTVNTDFGDLRTRRTRLGVH